MTKKRRYLISAGIFGACVCIALGVLAMLPSQPGVLKASFDRIEIGMSREEVEAILGDGNEISRRTRMWSHADGSQVFVWFDDDAAVREMEYRVLTKTFSDKLRRWIGMGKQEPNPLTLTIK